MSLHIQIIVHANLAVMAQMKSGSGHVGGVTYQIVYAYRSRQVIP